MSSHANLHVLDQLDGARVGDDASRKGMRARQRAARLDGEVADWSRRAREQLRRGEPCHPDPDGIGVDERRNREPRGAEPWQQGELAVHWRRVQIGLAPKRHGSLGGRARALRPTTRTGSTTLAGSLLQHESKLQLLVSQKPG